MSEPIQISAVIPTYNRGHIVGRAIESALAQEYGPSEIIVVDDGSSDGTRQVVQSYGKKVRYVYEPNAGVSAARNRGVREATCDWIAFLDSDDCWAPQHLRRMVNAIDGTRGKAALYFADLRLPGADGGSHYWGLCGFEIDGDWEFRRDASGWAVMRIQPMMLQASVIARRAYCEVGGLPEQLRTREDTFLFFELALLYPACAVSGCGTVMNSDGDMRLTLIYNENSLVYSRATIVLYGQLLASMNNIAREHRRFLRDSLAESYFGISRVWFRQRKYLETIGNLVRSCGVSPLVFGKEMLGSLSRRFFKKTGRERTSRIDVGQESNS